MKHFEAKDILPKAPSVTSSSQKHKKKTPKKQAFCAYNTNTKHNVGLPQKIKSKRAPSFIDSKNTIPSNSEGRIIYIRVELIIQGFNANNARPKTTTCIPVHAAIYGFHGSCIKKKNLPKKTSNTVQGLHKTEFRPTRTWKTASKEKITKMFREHPEIEESTNKVEKGEKEVLITEMLKKYAHSYPQNQVILNKIVEANIHKVQLANTNTKAKDTINTVISQCKFLKQIDNDERRSYIRSMTSKEDTIAYKHPWLDEEVNI